MNKTGIEWTEFTWNPVKGCEHGCSYCYGREMANRFNGGDFTPSYHPDILEEPIRRKKPSKIFVCSMSDIGGEFVQKDWFDEIMNTIDRCPRHTFQLLTKAPDHLATRLTHRRENVWVGASVESQEKTWRIDALKQIETPVRFVSFEPLHGDITYDLKGINWVIIGAQTGRGGFQPDQEYVDHIIEQARDAGCSVFLKDNLEHDPHVQEWPEVTI